MIQDQDLATMRAEYKKADLHELDVPSDPLALFARWFGEARQAQAPEPNAMTLATVTPDGRPSARVVLLKGVEGGGFVFYTNQHSHKGRDLDANPWAALTFWWAPLERQVRVEGRAAKVADHEADAYFALRPRSAQLGAWASAQSTPISSRCVLDEEHTRYDAMFQGRDVPRPPHWGGYRVTPNLIEFWQGRPSRLHDRLRYDLDEAGRWGLARLAP